MENGIPRQRRRSAPPFITAASAARAEASACVRSTTQNALTLGFTRSMRSSTARVSSTGEISLARIMAASRVAGV